MTKLTHKMGLSRDRILFMSILLGCDFFPSGVSGVGRESVMQMIDRWPRHWDALCILKFWIQIQFEPWIHCFGDCFKSTTETLHCTYCQSWRNHQASLGDRDCVCALLSGSKELLRLETTVKKKCTKVDPTWWITGFPKIIDEFNTSEELPDLKRVKQLSCPKVGQCLSILVKKLAWEETYALDTLIPILTRWQLRHLCSGGNVQVVEPVEILKKRVVGGVPNLNMHWRVLRDDAEETKGVPTSFESCDPTELIANAYPELYENYVAVNEKPKKAPRKKAAPKIKKQTAIPEEDLQEQTQKPITQFFMQKKKPSTPKITKKLVIQETPEEEIKESMAASLHFAKEENCYKENDSSFEDSACSEISFIIDDILSKRVHKVEIARKSDPKKIEKATEKKSSSLLLPFTTSTPTSYRPRPKLTCIAQNKIVPKNLHQQVLHSNMIDQLKTEEVPFTEQNVAAESPKYYAHKNPRDISKTGKVESPDLFDLSEEDSFDRMCK